MSEYIHGLEKIMSNELPKGHVILIVGEPGTLKSTLAYALGCMAIEGKDSMGVYVTLEQTSGSLLQNVKNLKLPVNENLVISDLASFMIDLDTGGVKGIDENEFFDLILDNLKRPIPLQDAKVQKKPTVFILDSINAMSALIFGDQNGMRKNLQTLLFKLKSSNITCILIMEVGDLPQYHPEYFMADGIIELGIAKTEKGKLKRFIRVRKMRYMKHSLQPFLLEASEENGIRIISELI